MVVIILVVVIAIFPRTDASETEQADRTPTREAEKLVEIANHSGAYVTWYIDQATEVCKENYLDDYCRPAVYELTESEPCGLMPVKRTDWPADLPDGKPYFIRMESGRGITTGYKQISYGSRYEELPDQQQVFYCWADFGILR